MATHSTNSHGSMTTWPRYYDPSWASVVIDMAPGWSSLCRAIVSAWKEELDGLQLNIADENTFALGDGNVLDDDIYKESANGSATGQKGLLPGGSLNGEFILHLSCKMAKLTVNVA